MVFLFSRSHSLRNAARKGNPGCKDKDVERHGLLVPIESRQLLKLRGVWGGVLQDKYRIKAPQQ